MTTYLKGQQVYIKITDKGQVPIPDKAYQINNSIQTINGYVPSLNAYWIKQQDILLDAAHIHPDNYDQIREEVHNQPDHITEAIKQFIQQQVHIELLEHDNKLNLIQHHAQESTTLEELKHHIQQTITPRTNNNQELYNKAKQLSDFIGLNPIFDLINPEEQERLKELTETMWERFEHLHHQNNHNKGA